MKSSPATIFAALLTATPLLAQVPVSPSAPPAPAAQSEVSPGTTATEPPSAPATAPPVRDSDLNPGSGVRIVRLSQVKGDVQLDRRTDRGFEPAFSNLPIVQGARLRTAVGVAEIELEDGSTLRLVPDTVVDFPTLTRATTGETATLVHVTHGTVYAMAPKSKLPGSLTLRTANGDVHLTPGSHLRLEVAAPVLQLAVLDGSAELVRPNDTIAVPKKRTLRLDTTAPDAPTLISKNEPSLFDVWDKDSVDYHQRFANASAFTGSGGMYGVSDLNYYGGFSNLSGCGSVWRPYFASAAWDPYANGTWAFYPGAGYSWVSPYPWGWTPFHSGSWIQCGNAGWGWRPGGSFVALNNTPNRLSPTRTLVPRPPSAAGLSSRPTLVVVNTRPLSVSRATSPESFVFERDSAGLGVPRQTFGRLDHASSVVAQHGAATAPMVSTMPTATVPGQPSSNLRGGTASRATTSASAPPPSSSNRSSGSASTGNFGGARGGGGSSSGGGGSTGSSTGGRSSR